MGALYKGFIVSAVASIPLLYIATKMLFPDMNAVVGGAAAQMAPAASRPGRCSTCMLIGLAVTGLIVWITEYYTGTNYRPVRSIAKASVTGHGTNIIQGLAIGLEATALPTLVICVGMIIAYSSAGVIGIGFAATSCWRWPAWSSRSMPMAR
jgi:K(+)-stimulated pyrophosphate-energized sodium pump